MPDTKIQTINPKKNVIIQEYAKHTAAEIEKKIDAANDCFASWKQTEFSQRAEKMQKLAKILRDRKSEFAKLMQDEMGKLINEAESEIEKCAFVCEYYAENAEKILADEVVKTDAKKSFITYQPIGVVFAIMPWNFPFWQVFRFAAPNIMAGNVSLLKHASNVTGCALKIEELFEEAGFPKSCFTTLLVSGSDATEIIANKNIRAVTLTGSAAAGKAVAAKAGEYLKKSVLELGGSDPYVILADADIDLAAEICAKARLINAGQTCIAAKRFIVVSEVLQEFTEKFKAHMEAAKIAPMARPDLRDDLHKQVEASVKEGAKLLLGGKKGDATYYEPTILTEVTAEMTCFKEELFGPVAAIIEAANEDEAFELANKTIFGLGSAIFSKDEKRAEELARTKIDAGLCSVNSFVSSDPRLPFGGVKESGYGREVGVFGIREFVNIKTVSVN